MDDLRPTAPEMDKADARWKGTDEEERAMDAIVGSPRMTVRELGSELSDTLPYADWKVVTAINFGMGEGAEERFPIELVVWDHDNKQLVLVQGYDE